MRVLYVGFKGKNNASFRLVSAFKGERLFLTNSFEGLKRDIEALTVDSDAVYMFGIDKALSGSVRIERYAELSGQLLRTKLSAEMIEDQLHSNGIACRISDAPTHYLCNDAYYHMLQKTGGRAIFIHIPGNRYMTDEMMAGIVRSLGESLCPSFQNR